MALLKSLASERERWDAGSETFKSQMATIVGDVLLTSAFMAYAGYFDQHMRQHLFTTWFSHMQDANILFKHDIARIEVSDHSHVLFSSTAHLSLTWLRVAVPVERGRPTEVAGERASVGRPVRRERNHDQALQPLPPHHRPEWSGHRVHHE